MLWGAVRSADRVVCRTSAGARAGQCRGDCHPAARSQPLAHVSQRRSGGEGGIDRPCLRFDGRCSRPCSDSRPLVIYNVFARSIAGYRAKLGDAAAEVLRLVSRDLERTAAAPLERAPGEPAIGRRVRLADATGGPRGSS